MEMKPKVEDRFDQFFSEKPKINYTFNLRNLGRKDRKIVQTLKKFGITGRSCLDIGPGTGRWIQFLNKNNAGYIGAVDISDVSLKRVEQYCDSFQKANFEIDKFEYKSDFFDIVISFEVMEHLGQLDNYLSEIVRVTKKGGIVLISLPNIISLISRIRMIFGSRPVAIASDPTHVGFYRQKDLIRLFKKFEINPIFIPTSISLNPLNPKSRFRIPSCSLLSSFDDSHLIIIQF
jgi:2-polyprenyl-3-methyl-5-hydroxy-6-metoxy-1,4-benzoquinol methylase